jgi:hypothetical protein
MIEENAAIGLAALPWIVSGVIGALKPLLQRLLPGGLAGDVTPALALLLGGATVSIGAAGGVVDADNPFVVLLLGVNVGLAAIGAREATRQYREPGQ